MFRNHLRSGRGLVHFFGSQQVFEYHGDTEHTEKKEKNREFTQNDANKFFETKL
jgi:hypothetical protein